MKNTEYHPFVFLFLILITVTSRLWAQENEDAPWPKITPVPRIFAKSRHLKRYGRPVELFTDKQRETLWNARIRKDHPRIFINRDTLPAIRKTMSGDRASLR